VWPRGRDEFAELFDDLEVVPPGVVPVSEWRSEPGEPVPARENVSVWGAVGRKR
jgi:hypothetical protein